MKEVNLYTDGACRGNPGRGGWGAILVYGKYEKELSGGDPETEIGRVCVQLASPDFKYMNGETLTLEGGMGLRP